MKLLVIEDDPAMGLTLARALSRRGMQVHICADGAAAVKAWQAARPDAVLLDLTLPGRDGLDVLADARALGLETPVLMLTARGTVGDRVLGLNAGADDYLPKPFDLDELEARVRAMVRAATRGHHETIGGDDNFGALRHDGENGAFYLRGVLLELSSRERALLTALFERRGQALSKEKLFDRVFPGAAEVQHEAIEVVAYRLRKKLDGTGLTLVTLRGLGYLLTAGGKP